jgi:hypothetical protein
MNILLIALIIAAAAGAAVFVGRSYANARFFFKTRERIPVDLVLSLDPAGNGLNPEIYCKVAGKLALAVELEIDQIRPSDKLTEIFSRDSWNMGEGQEQFESWLREQIVGHRDELQKAISVADIVLVMQSSPICRFEHR